MLYLYAFEIILAVAAVVSCVRTATADMPGLLPRAMWLLLILIIPLIGPIAWFVIRWAANAEKNSPDGRLSIPRHPREFFGKEEGRQSKLKEPVAPDDNEDFLFSLEAQMRRERMAKAERERKAAEEARKNQANKSNVPGDEGTREQNDPRDQEHTAGNDSNSDEENLRD